MKLISILLLCVLSVLCGCATVVTKVDPVKVSQQSTGDLINLHFYWEKHPELASIEARHGIEADLRRRGITDRDFSAVRNKTPYIGMRQEVLIEALGKPLRNNYTQTAYGMHQQLIFGSSLIDQPYYYVYLDNGIVSAIQNRQR